MLDYQYILADIGDAVFIVVVIVAMIVTQIVKLFKQEPKEDDTDYETTFSNTPKRHAATSQNELEDFLKNLATGATVKKATPPAVPPRQPRVERTVIPAVPVRRASPPPVAQKPPVARRKRKVQISAPTPAITPEPTPVIQETLSEQQFNTQHAYDQERHHEVCESDSLHEIRISIGEELISENGLRKAIVLNEILGPPIALRRT